MDKETFETNYCGASEITREFYNEHLVSLPCSCDSAECDGWASVSNNEVSVKAHNFLHNREHETYRKKAPKW